MVAPVGDALAEVATVPPGSDGSRVGHGGSVPHSSLTELISFGAGKSASDGAGAVTPSPVGIFVGEGLPPVPSRLAERIRRWEFVEMCELLPELLANQKVGDSDTKQPGRARGRKRVQEIGVWLQCFAVFVGVVAKSSPEAVPGLMAYMISIIRASQEYEGAAWAAYDAAFRRQAAATKLRDWSAINSSLYTICFTGKARRSQRCDHCLSAAHKTADCYALGDDEGDVAGRVRAVESVLVALSSHGSGVGRAPRSAEVCRLFNERRCNFRNCKYRHVCKWCNGNHPGCDCRVKPEQGPGPIRNDGPWRPGGGPTPY